MLTDTVPGTTNVVRFPLERRTTLDLLRDIAPDAREVSLLAETYDIALLADLQDRADHAAAEHILNHAAASGRERADMLREMLDHAVGIAVAAVRASQRLAQAAAGARRDLADAKAGSGFWMQDLEHDAAELSAAAAEALVAAHGRTLEAFGVARAVDLAVRGEAWAPRDHHAEMDWLLAVEAKRQAG